MINSVLRSIPAFWVCLGLSGTANSQDSVAQRGFLLAKQYCYSCHGVQFEGNAKLNFGDPASLINNGYVKLGEDAEDSKILRRMESGEMPPEDSPQPTAEERAALKAWVLAGVPKPPRELPREFRTERSVIADILADLQPLPKRDQPFKRYFTLHHLANNASVSTFDLRLYRAAISVAINSLSLEEKIVVPVAVDSGQTLFRIDVRDLGWDRDRLWRRVLQQYPYGLTFDDQPDVRDQWNELDEISGTPLPYVRGDWFAITATRPPLYHLFMNTPGNSRELEERLSVDLADAFQGDSLAMAGFDESGVSTGPRVVSRVSLAGNGYYWASFDFKPGSNRSSLYRFPFPEFDINDSSLNRFAFEHDGGEIIYSLPNGMQGYMLVDGKGNQINEGPIAVVRDSKQIAGTPEVVNGISCMHCHRHGMRDFQDAVRDANALAGEPAEKVASLYLTQVEMKKLVEKDKNRFVAALEQAIGPFLQVDEDAERQIQEFPEPIGEIAQRYQRDLNLQDFAAEIGFEDTERLKQELTDDDFLRLGLGPLTIGRRVNRSAVDSREFTASPFQEAAQQLGIGEGLAL